MPGPPLETGNNAQVGKYLQCSHKWDTNEYMGGFVKCHSQFFVTDYGVDPDMFEGYGHRESLFERNRKKMSTMFTKWKCREKRMEYLQRHTLSNCKECAILHTTLQNAYPGKKSELSKDVATMLSAAINGCSNQREGRNTCYKRDFGWSPTVIWKTIWPLIHKLPGSQLQAKPNSVTKKRDNQRECKEEIELTL